MLTNYSVFAGSVLFNVNAVASLCLYFLSLSFVPRLHLRYLFSRSTWLSALTKPFCCAATSHIVLLPSSRYRTQLCNEPASCRRKVCFFAHTLEELREPSNPLDAMAKVGGRPSRVSLDNGLTAPFNVLSTAAHTRRSLDVPASPQLAATRLQVSVYEFDNCLLRTLAFSSLQKTAEGGQPSTPPLCLQKCRCRLHR